MNYDVLNQVIVLFLIMIVGIYSAKRGYVNGTVQKGINDLILKITLPLLIISTFNMEYDPVLMDNARRVAVYSVFIHIGLFFITKFLYIRMPKNINPTLRFMTVFSNVGFMGYPILQSIFGSVGVFYGAIFNMVFNTFVWTLGVSLYSDDKWTKNIMNIIKNPIIISIVIGIILFVTPLTLPGPILDTAKLIGNTTTPMSMILVGAMLSDVKIKEVLKDWTLYYGSFMCLIVVPLLVYIIMKILGLPYELTKLCTIIVAMPGAVMTPIVASKYNGNYLYASKCIFMTTLLSVITIPIILMFI